MIIFEIDRWNLAMYTIISIGLLSVLFLYYKSALRSKNHLRKITAIKDDFCLMIGRCFWTKAVQILYIYIFIGIFSYTILITGLGCFSNETKWKVYSRALCINEWINNCFFRSVNYEICWKLNYIDQITKRFTKFKPVFI